MTGDYYPRARSTDLVIQTVGNETLVYDLKSNEAHCLNETAAFVWSKCNGDLSIDEVGRGSGKWINGGPVDSTCHLPT